MNESQAYVYIWHNPETGQVYVGSTNEEKRRFSEHVRQLQCQVHPNSRFQKAYEQNPNFEFLSVPVQDRNEAYEVEQAIINEFHGSPQFLNLDTQVGGGGYVRTPETRAKQSASAVERMKDPSVREYLRLINTGKAHTPETVEKLRESSRGNSHARGNVFTQESRDKVSRALKGVPRTAAAIENIRQAAIDRRRTDVDLRGLRRASEERQKPVIVEGSWYPSATAVARAYGIGLTTVSYRLNSEGFSAWNYV